MKHLVVLIFTLVALTVYSQTEPRVLTFGDEGSEFTPYESEKNAVKFDLIGVLMGSYKMSYERVLNSYFTVEGSLGATYGSTFLSNIFLNPFIDSDWDNLGDRSPKLGLTFSFGTRFYLIDVFDEWYVELGYYNRVNRWDVSMEEFGSNEIYTEKRRRRGPRIMLGYMNDTFGNLIFDTGFGISREAVREDRVEFNQSGSSDLFEVVTRDLENRIGLFYTIKIGYIF